MKAKLSIVLLAIFLFGCAAGTKIVENDRAIIGKANADSGQTYIVEIPSAGNPVADAMLVAAIRGGKTTSASEVIDKLLCAENVKHLGVVGVNRAINRATVQQAIRSVKETSGVTVYVVGREDDYADIQEEARAKGINLQVLSSAPIAP